MRDTEWNVNSRRRLAEWQSTRYSQRECLMRAERWHLRGTLNCDSFSPVFKARPGYFAHWRLPLTNVWKKKKKKKKTWTEMSRNPQRWHCQWSVEYYPEPALLTAMWEKTFRPFREDLSLPDDILFHQWQLREQHFIWTIAAQLLGGSFLFQGPLCDSGRSLWHQCFASFSFTSSSFLMPLLCWWGIQAAPLL